MANTIAVSAPAPTLLAGTNGVRKTLPAPTLSATLTWPGDSIAITFDRSAPAPSLSATALSGAAIGVVVTAPLPLLTAVLGSASILTFTRTAPSAHLVASVLTGNVASALLLPPAPTLVAAGHPAYILTAALAARAPRLSATLTAAIVSGFRTWVMNTRKAALTEYGPEFAFNSYATFNGVVIAAGSGGLVSLGVQGLDGATAITGRVRTGAEGFGSSFLKRVPRIYTSLSAAGDMKFRTITTEGGTRTYSLPFNGVTGIQQRRVPVGKGPKSRFWTLEWENVNGADFSINDLHVYPVVLRRRVF